MRFLTRGDIDHDVIGRLESNVYRETRLEKSEEHQVRCFGRPRWIIDHVTRHAEYPFALKAVDAFSGGGLGRVFDVGSDPKFSVGVSSLCDHITMHYTHQNTCHMGLLGGPGEMCSLHDWVARNRGKVAMVNQTPPVSVVERHAYDVVFCLSVLEHVYPEDLADWERFIVSLVKPGGVIVFTCDWLLSGEMPGEIFNHQYGLFQVPEVDENQDDLLVCGDGEIRLAVFGGVVRL